jgi:hypothetical protein
MGAPVYFLDPACHEAMAAELSANGYTVGFGENEIVIGAETGAEISLGLDDALPGIMVVVYTSRKADRPMEKAIEAAILANGGGHATKEQMEMLGKWTRSQPQGIDPDDGAGA